MGTVKTILTVISIVVGFVALMAGIAYGSYVLGNVQENSDCKRYERITGKDTRHEWAFGPSCYVLTEHNGWVLLDQLKVNN